MTNIILPPHLDEWAKSQVAQGAEPDVGAVVEKALLASKSDSDWVNQKVAEALASVEKEGWVDGDTVLAQMDQWIVELDQEIREYDACRDERKRA